MLNSPSPFVSVVRVIPVSTFRTVTFAPVIAAPVVSVTDPRIVPRNVCAFAVPAIAAIDSKTAHTSATRTPQPCDFLIAVPLSAVGLSCAKK
jgi:hypothetical protein